ncbi:MAG TPA: hypothetical protein DEQ61_20835, partial [Streptomyces sp.]|nr:hypothetical protein [Streptomyces sp.]
MTGSTPFRKNPFRRQGSPNSREVDATPTGPVEDAPASTEQDALPAETAERPAGAHGITALAPAGGSTRNRATSLAAAAGRGMARGGR